MDRYYSARNLVTKVGGEGGAFASVLLMGVTQPPGTNDSALEIVRGGAGGGLGLLGGATKPGSPDPSPCPPGLSVANTLVQASTVISNSLVFIT